MRRVAVFAGLLGALATPPASSQPAPPTQNVGWRTAAAAALAFGDAEGKMLALRRHSIRAAPTTKASADALLDEVDRLATVARNGYLVVEHYGSPFWTVAAEIRIGDTFICQAEKFETIPIPPQLAAAAQRLPPNLLDEYLEVLHGLARPLRDQAGRVWERAAAKTDAPRFMVDRARDRLAGKTFPDC